MSSECSDGRKCHSDVVIQVKAQVMARDDSSGGWVPVSGGGVSRVALLRDIVSATATAAGVVPADSLKPVPMQPDCSALDDTHSVYVIEGRRLADDVLVLKCTLKLDIQYVAANPTFHHWRTGSKRYGLTFQSPSDARAFERSIHRAASEITHGRHRQLSALLSLPHSRVQRHCGPGNEDIFMMLHFSGDRRETSTESTADSEPASTESSPQHDVHLPGVNDGSCHCLPLGSSCALPTHSDMLSPSFVAAAHGGAVSSHARLYHRPSPMSAAAMEESLENEYNNKIQLLEESRLKRLHDDGDDNTDDVLSLESSYVRFAKTDLEHPSLSTVHHEYHEYCYPTLDTLSPTIKRDTIMQQRLDDSNLSARRATVSAIPVSLPSRLPPVLRQPQCENAAPRLTELGSDMVVNTGGQYSLGGYPVSDSSRRLVASPRRREMCLYCGEWFDADRHEPCTDARDKMADCIGVATCACVADAIAYHCLSDTEGDYEQPTTACSCSSRGGGITKWMVYVLLSLVLPCLCCYWPMIACRRCAARCGCCVVHHEAARRQLKPDV